MRKRHKVKRLKVRREQMRFTCENKTNRFKWHTNAGASADKKNK